jgi:hypothetical protein
VGVAVIVGVIVFGAGLASGVGVDVHAREAGGGGESGQAGDVVAEELGEDLRGQALRAGVAVEATGEAGDAIATG